MIQKIPSLNKLVHELSRLPGVGPKSAQRLAYHILRSPQEFVLSLRDALKQVKEKIHDCPVCFSFTEEDGACHFCTDPMRSDDVLFAAAIMFCMARYLRSTESRPRTLRFKRFWTAFSPILAVNRRFVR
jgi:hypothetical protein